MVIRLIPLNVKVEELDSDISRIRPESKNLGVRL